MTMLGSKLGRRRFLGFMAAAPIAGPAIAKAAAEKVMCEQSGVSAAIYPHQMAGMNPSTIGGASLGYDPTRAAARLAYKIPELRKELEALLYQQHRHVSFLDVDLASKRSFSLAAKIAFQRQRNVQREIENEIIGEPIWGRTQKWVSSAMARFGVSLTSGPNAGSQAQGRRIG